MYILFKTVLTNFNVIPYNKKIDEIQQNTTNKWYL